MGHEKSDDLSSWVDMEYGLQVHCYDSDIQYRNAWIINIYGPNLHCTVCHGDSDLLFEDDTYSEVMLVGLGIIKFPWNKQKIKKERQFLENIAFALKNAELNIKDES